MTELNQKFTKSMPRRHSLWGVYMREKYLYEKLAVKEGRIYPLERGIFSGANSIF